MFKPGRFRPGFLVYGDINMGKRLDQYISEYVVFDLETTGISTKKDKIIEISAIRVKDGEEAAEFSTLVNPEQPIPYHATLVNNITDEMVADAPTIAEALPEFLDFAGESVLLGQNIQQFDLKYIYRDCLNLGLEVPGNDFMDTLPLSRVCLPELPHHSLGDLAAHFGISTAGAHRALADCRMTYRVYEKLGPMIEAANSAVTKCPKCGRNMVKRKGKFGIFWGCSGYPACTCTRKI